MENIACRTLQSIKQQELKRVTNAFARNPGFTQPLLINEDRIGSSKKMSRITAGPQLLPPKKHNKKGPETRAFVIAALASIFGMN